MNFISWVGDGSNVGAESACRAVGTGGAQIYGFWCMVVAARGLCPDRFALQSWLWFWLHFPSFLSSCPAAFSSLPGDSVSSLVFSDILFYCSSHPETDSAANKRLEWVVLESGVWGGLREGACEEARGVKGQQYLGISGTLWHYWKWSRGWAKGISAEGSSELCCGDGTYVVSVSLCFKM